MRKNEQLVSKVVKLGAILLGKFVFYAPIAHAQSGPPIQKEFIEGAPIQKKFIQVSMQNLPDTVKLRANLKELEKSPFDGVMLNAYGRDDTGKSVPLQTTFSDVPWKQEWFQSCVDDLKSVHSTKLTDNFIKVVANPGNVDWFDDAGWKEIANHWRIAAWIAKEGNLKGIAFDAEPYTKGYRQFEYVSQPGSLNHTLEQYRAKARQRGHEIISAVAAVDPSLVLFTFFMNSHEAKALSTSNPVIASRFSYYNLYSAFINGWLDAAPPTMTFVGSDGAFLYNSQEDYLKGANLVRNEALRFVAPENRQKYAAQVQTSFGMYLDANVNPSANRWYIDPKGSTRTERMKINATYAINAATEYVWIYGEKYSWWPALDMTSNTESWEDKLPGITQALLDVTHPQQAKERAMAEAVKNAGENLVVNANFAQGPPAAPVEKTMDWKTAGMPANWDTWQFKDSHASFGFDPKMSHSNDGSGSVKIAGAAAAFVVQAVQVKPGETYAVQAWTRHHGRGLSTVLVRWQLADGTWISNSNNVNVTMYNSEMPEQDKWQLIRGIVTVPTGAGRLVIMTSQEKQQADTDMAWYDDISVRQIE